LFARGLRDSEKTARVTVSLHGNNVQPIVLMGVAGVDCYARLVLCRRQVTDQFVEASGSGIEYCLSVERRDESVTELLYGVPEDHGYGEEIHIGDQSDELAAVGISLAVRGVGMGVTPGSAFEGNLPASQTSWENIGAEADF
jgi:hypothetical protein